MQCYQGEYLQVGLIKIVLITYFISKNDVSFQTAPMQEPMAFATISRPMNDSLFPPFLKNTGMGSRNSSLRDAKKDGRNISTSGMLPFTYSTC